MVNSIDRNYLIVKSNELVQNTKYNLSVQEQKLILRLIQMIRPDDDCFSSYEISLKEFCKFTGIDYKNGGNFLNIKNTILSLKKKSFWLWKENTQSWVTVDWISKVEIEKNTGIIKVKLDDDLKPFLLQLKNNFTQYEMIHILAMKSKYSIRIYELLKSYQYKQNIIFNIDDLKAILACDKYNRISDLKRYVIEPATKEINLYSDIDITVQYIKQGRKVEKIKFEINEKMEYEKEEAERITKKLLNG